MKKPSQILRAYNSQMRETVLLKFGMWGAEGGERLHYENDLISTREHRATYALRFHFSSSCKYTHDVARQLTWPHDTLPCVLISSWLQYT